MLVPHACLNAAAGRLFKSPLKAFAAGLATHALLDLVPHKDISAHKAEGAAVLMLLGLAGASCGLSSPVFWCAVGGVLPDVEQVLPWTDPKRGHRRWFPTHSHRFHSLKLSRAPHYRSGLLGQSMVSAAALLIAVTRCRPCDKSG